MQFSLELNSLEILPGISSSFRFKTQPISVPGGERQPPHVPTGMYSSQGRIQSTNARTVLKFFGPNIFSFFKFSPEIKKWIILSHGLIDAVARSFPRSTTARPLFTLFLV